MINQLMLACMMWFKNLRKTCACVLRVAASLPRTQTPSAELCKGGRREGDLNFSSPVAHIICPRSSSFSIHFVLAHFKRPNWNYKHLFCSSCLCK